MWALCCPICGVLGPMTKSGQHRAGVGNIGHTRPALPRFGRSWATSRRNFGATLGFVGFATGDFRGARSIRFSQKGHCPLAGVDEHVPEIGRAWLWTSDIIEPVSKNSEPMFSAERSGPKSDQHWTPGSATHFGYNIGRTCSESGQTRVQLGQLWPMTAKFEPFRACLANCWAHFGHIWATSVDLDRTNAEFGLASTKSAPISTNFGRLRPICWAEFHRCRSISAKFGTGVFDLGQNWSGIRPSSASLWLKLGIPMRGRIL